MNPIQSDQPPPTTATAKKRILVVDDDITASQLLKIALEQTGRFDVRVENVGAHGAAAARAFLPDIAILDVCMPGKNGGDVAADIRADPRLRDVGIIFLTSIVSEKEAGSHPVISGGYPFLAKPVRVGSLLQLIEETLGAGSALGRSPLR